MKVQGKVAIVTGAASGLGLASARRLAEAGANIVGLDLDDARMGRLRESVPAAQLLTQAANVANEASVAAAIAAAIERFGAIHIVVNCAGVADAAKTVSRGQPFPMATWDKVIGVNLTGTFNMIRLAAVHMVGNDPGADDERGVIVNTSSGAAWQGQIGQAAYSASKAAVMGLTLPVARDLAPHGIRVVSIAPGLFDTAMVAGMPENVSRAITEKMVLFPNRMGRGDEFAHLVQTIVENSYFNATTISLDAGARMSAR